MENQQKVPVDVNKLEEVENVQYPGPSIIEDVTSGTEIKRRLAIATGNRQHIFTPQELVFFKH